MAETFTPDELARLRAEPPGTAHRIHLNNAGAALMPAPVLSAVTDHLRREAEIGGYEAKAEQSDRIEGVYRSVARLLNAHVDEIALAENATVAWQWAFYAQTFSPGDRILTTTAEYAANYLAYLQIARRTGAVVETIPDRTDGTLDPRALEAMIDGRVRLIAITWIPTNGGLVNPAAEVGRIARAYGVPYLLDACQAAGQLPIDVDAIGCDMLAATGRKFLRGPRGTGFLYIRRALLESIEPAMIDLFGAEYAGDGGYSLRPDARRFESWESDYAARLGLGVAIDYALEIGLDRIEKRCRLLGDRMRARLADIPGISIHDLGPDPAAIIGFTLSDIAAADAVARLSAQGFNLSVSVPTSTPIDAWRRGLPNLVRASPHYYNSEEEIDLFADAVARLA
ncbi:MAG: aminotransferase class V-fold PLP-dependent enzyme [Sphingobium sp.]